jgi:iron complex outermembrane receptor protein
LLLNSSTSEVMQMGDAKVKAEQALKFTGTYRWEFKNLQIEASPYANYILNYIYLRPERLTVTTRGPAPSLRYTQTDALFLGADLMASLHLKKYFSVTPKITLLRASDERNHDYLIFIPSNRYEVTVRYEKPSLNAFRNFYAESKALYVSKQTRAPRVISGRELVSGVDPFINDKTTFDFVAPPNAYWLWNLAVGFSLKKEKVQYDFRIASENTLNQNYREYTNRFRYYADDLGRNIIFSIKCIF